MKLGFLDSIFNYADVYDAASSALSGKIANVSLERMTTPHLLKIPLCAKLLFARGCDAVIVFLTALPDDFDQIRLVEEKIIDVEMQEKKFVFVVVVSDAEFDNEDGLKELAAQRLGFIAEAVQKIVESPSEMHSQIANADMASAMSMFSGEPQAPAQAEEAADAGTGEEIAGGAEAGSGSSEEDEGQSLF
ncbi:MAG: hypothetical protein V1708_00170 [Candidatus Micrarchaeota archaeon]